ncbi:MAG: OmpA family protein, partial [Longimicrobiales bacterium]
QGKTLALTGALEYTERPDWRGTLRGEFRATDRDDQFLGSIGSAYKINRDVSLLGQSVISHVFDGETYSRTRVGIAYRNRLSNLFNGLARYEHRYESRRSTNDPDAFRAAHLFVGNGNWKASPSLTVSSQLAAKWTQERRLGEQINEPASLLGVRTTLDLPRRWDISATARSFGLGTVVPFYTVDSREWGLGFELGFHVTDGLRLAGGYNAFGFSDEELTEGVPTDRGFYIDLSWTFDDGLFGLARDRTSDPIPTRTRPLAGLGNDCPGAGCPIIRGGPVFDIFRPQAPEVPEDMPTIGAALARLHSLPTDTMPAIRYQRAKAEAWLELARVEYLDMDTTAVADTAFARARHLVRLLEGDRTDTLEIDPILPPGVDSLGALWQEIERLASHPCIYLVPEKLAQAEVRVAWSANEYRTLGAGDNRPHDDIAVQRIQEANDGLAVCYKYPIPDRVHFAYNRDALSATTKRALNWVAQVVTRPQIDSVHIVLRGQADRDGDPNQGPRDPSNESLARRRAQAVRDYLQSLTAGDPTVTYQIEDTLPASREATWLDQARDRRVGMEFRSSDSHLLAPFQYLFDLQLTTPVMDTTQIVSVLTTGAMELADHGHPEVGEYLLQPLRLPGDGASRDRTLALIDAQSALVSLQAYQGKAARDTLVIDFVDGEPLHAQVSVANHLFTIASWYVSTGRLTDGRDLNQRVRNRLQTILDAVPAPDTTSWDYGRLLATVGMAHFSAGAYAEAIQAYERAVEIFETLAVPVPNDSTQASRSFLEQQDTVLALQFGLAELYRSNDELVRADSLHRHVLEQRLALEAEGVRSGPLDLIRSLNSLAVVVDERADGDPAAAEALREEAQDLYAQAVTRADTTVGEDRFLSNLIKESQAQLEAALNPDSLAVDSDFDGVLNDLDGVLNETVAVECRQTPPGAIVHPVGSPGAGLPRPPGCALDSDEDFVPDYRDRCSETRWGAIVNFFGCPVDVDWDFIPERDFDRFPIPKSDSVAGLDHCPDTPDGRFPNHFGCEVGPADTIPPPFEWEVRFEQDQATITDEGREVLLALLREVGDNACPREWALSGYASEEGSEARNDTLSRDRVHAVSDFLASRLGSNHWDPLVTWHGEMIQVPEYSPEQVRAMTDDARRAWWERNRRVVIKVSRFDSPDPAPGLPGLFGLWGTGMPTRPPAARSWCQ